MTAFGLASTAFRSHRLGARDIDAMKAAGFDTLDLVATAGHLEIADVAQLDELVRSSREAGVAIRSLSVAAGELPAMASVAVDRGWPLVIGRTGPCRVTETRADAATALAPILEKLELLLPERGVSVAIQTPGGRALSSDAIVAILESIDDPRFGVCLDAGHAHLSGGAPESAESASGLVMAAILHDNTGREDLHRAPGEGAINWAAVLIACWKTGFSGPWILDVADEPGRLDTVSRAVSARARLQAILEDLAQPMTFPE
jgi:sugar phosphate isomerase/epimerase